jgi:hypothetical protein
MGDKDEPLNDSPELRDAIRSIEAIGEDQSGIEQAPPASGAGATDSADPRTPPE